MVRISINIMWCGSPSIADAFCAGLWSPGFFSSTVGLNGAVIRWYVDHQERVAQGHMQLKFEFQVPRGVSPWVSTMRCVPKYASSPFTSPPTGNCVFQNCAMHSRIALTYRFTVLRSLPSGRAFVRPFNQAPDTTIVGAGACSKFWHDSHNGFSLS